MLAKHLRAQGHETILTREPGGSPGAEEIRRLLVAGDPGRWSAETEILLFTAARRDHVERTIRPALGRGAIVLSDRYIDSTRVYQGNDQLREKVDRLHDMMIGLDPDLTLIFDLDADAGLDRADSRGGQEDRFEQRGAAFQRTLRTRFLEIAHADPMRCAVIEAGLPRNDVAAAVRSVVGQRIGVN